MILADYMVLIAALLPQVTVAFAKHSKTFDNADPRNTEKMNPWQLRMYSAHLNAFEIFPFFAFSVLLVQFLGVAVAWLNILSVIFILLRIAYIWVYANDKASARSAVFTLSLLCIIAIFFLPVIF